MANNGQNFDENVMLSLVALGKKSHLAMMCNCELLSYIIVENYFTNPALYVSIGLCLIIKLLIFELDRQLKFWL